MDSKSKNLIIMWVILLVVIGTISYIYLWKSTDKLVVDKWTIDTNFANTIDEKAEKAMLDVEKQKLVETLNRSLLPNYLKITNWKDYPKFWTYMDNNTTFFSLELEPNISDTTLADYDIRILKWSETEEDFNSKSQLYKDKTKNLLTNMLKKWQYSKLIENWVIGTITRSWKNKYQIDFLGDYIYNKYGINKNLSATIAWKIALLRDYFNFWSIYLSKKPDDFLKILNDIDTELKDKKFTELSWILKKVYFKNVTLTK